MTKSYAILVGPLALACLAIAFCIWSAMGNDLNICVTTGCMLYQDFTFAGISLWWFGALAFACLGACALLGQTVLGCWLAAAFLLGDICLLMLMALTAPCISCLGVALLFALAYLLFRRQARLRQRQPRSAAARHSFLLWLWLVLFIINVGQVARSQIGIWPILDESGEASTRMFFSPSCRYCLEGVKALSGNINVAFYPLAETEADIARVDKMMAILDQGMSLEEALAQSQEAKFESFWQTLAPDVLLLRFRMLRNKAHLFAQGSRGVPFFERKGLPSGLAPRHEKRSVQPAPVFPPASGSGDYAMPPELLQDSTQCGGQTPCPQIN